MQATTAEIKRSLQFIAIIHHKQIRPFQLNYVISKIQESFHIEPATLCIVVESFTHTNMARNFKLVSLNFEGGSSPKWWAGIERRDWERLDIEGV